MRLLSAITENIFESSKQISINLSTERQALKLLVMKNLIVSLTAMFVTAVAPALVHAADTDPRAEKIFSKQFSGAQNVKWMKLADGYLRVTFVLNGIGAETFFNADAELVGTVRNLFYNQLPLVVMQTVDNEFAGASVIEVKEITNDDGTSYKVVLEQNSKKYLLRLNSLGQITELLKEKLKK